MNNRQKWNKLNQAINNRSVNFEQELGNNTHLLNHVYAWSLPLLTSAVYKNRPDIVKILLNKGANINKAGPTHGDTALIVAARWGRTDMVKYLILRGANVNAQDVKGKTALMTAIKNGHIEIVEVLIRAGANLNVKDGRGRTALAHAWRKYNNKAVRALIKAGANTTGLDLLENNLRRLAGFSHKNFMARQTGK